MPSLLDDRMAISRIDSKDMLSAVERLPDFLLDQIDSGDLVVGGIRHKQFRNIVLMGMGGSASAADVTLDWLGDKISVPAFVHRDPRIPRFVGSNTLFVAMSYSGDTRETLVAAREAKKRAAHTICMGTGGKLRELSEAFSLPFLEIQSAPAPRAALGQMIVACARALNMAGVIRSQKDEIESAVRDLHRLNGRINVEKLELENPAKRFALSLRNRVPVIFAFRTMGAVARRFKNQLAENSKVVAKFSLLPEAAHNEIEAWHNQPAPLSPIFIRDPLETRFEKSMLESFRSTIRSASGIASQQVCLKSRSKLSRILLPTLYVDYVSVYLALLKGVDPTDTQWIKYYKSRL